MPTNLCLYHHFFKSLHHFSQLILFLNFIVSNQLLPRTHFSLWILHPQKKMFLMWSAHQRKAVRLRPIFRQSLMRHNYQEQLQGRQLASPPSPRWRQNLSQSIRIQMNPQFHTGLATNIQLCHPDSMISTCCPTTHLLCFDQTKNTAPITGAVWPVSNRYAPIYFEYHWRLGDTAHNHQRQYFFARMSQHGSIGMFLLVKFLTPMSPDKYLWLQARPPHRRLHDDKRRGWGWGCHFLKKNDCRSTPAGHAASPYQHERHPNAQKKLKH